MPYIKEYKLEYLLVFIGIVLTVSATTATAHIMKPLMDEMFIEKKEEMLYYIPLRKKRGDALLYPSRTYRHILF